MFDDKSILITGGTGSFGKQFVRTHARSATSRRRLVVFSRDELKQFEMAAGVRRTPCMRYFIGDVRDARPPDAGDGAASTIVIHAAALKQVPAAEYNPIECIKTNVHGAENVIDAALDGDVEQGHRAVDRQGGQPDQPLRRDQARARTSCSSPPTTSPAAHRTRFAVVRYGNVVGSRGSVVPFFQQADRRGRRAPADHRRSA